MTETLTPETLADGHERANPLLAALRELLYEPGQVYSEHALIKIMVARELLPADFARCPKRLFQVHFALFNALYRLRDELAGRRLVLDIGLVEVRVSPMSDARGQALAAGRENKLREYYLNWRHFDEATDESVAQLLSDFWRQVERRSVPDDDRREALAVFQLTEPVTYSQVKRRYRRLAMDTHPDRGGDNAQLQRINWAMSVLERALTADAC